MADALNKDTAKTLADTFIEEGGLFVRPLPQGNEKIVKALRRELLIDAMSDPKSMEKLEAYNAAAATGRDAAEAITKEGDKIKKKLFNNVDDCECVREVDGEGRFSGVAVIQHSRTGGKAQILAIKADDPLAQSYEAAYQAEQVAEKARLDAGKALRATIAPLAAGKDILGPDIEAVSKAMITLSPKIKDAGNPKEKAKEEAHRPGEQANADVDAAVTAVRAATSNYNDGTVLKKPESNAPALSV